MPSQIEQIKERLNIFDVARTYLPNIKKSGSNYFALCPFHNEKTPSFSINAELGIFKCFGCGESGDVLTFIQKMENVDFPEALRIAADRAGIKLDQTYSKQLSEDSKKKQELIKLNSLVAKYYNYLLSEHRLGKAGKSYLKKRNFSTKTIEKYNIGFAPSGYNNLINFLHKKGYTDKNLLVKNGLLIRRENSVIDKFRNRIIFPIYNHRGDIVGFSGRTIFRQTKAPKYLNSPQTIVYNKSEALFGLYQAKNSIRKNKYVIVVEGQPDTISSSQVGIENIVAPLGTALTEGQLRLIKRYTDTIYFCYDNDTAGEMALIRASILALKLDFKAFSISIPKDVSDVDELIIKDKTKWFDSVKQKQEVVKDITRRLSKRLDLSSAEGKSEIVNTLSPVISSIVDEVKISHYIHSLATLIDIPEDILSEKLKKDSKTLIQEHSDEKKVFPTSYISAEDYFLGLTLNNSEYIPIVSKKFKLKYFSNDEIISILESLFKYYHKVKRFSLKRFLKQLESNQIDTISNSILFRNEQFEEENDLIEELNKIYYRIKKTYYQKKLKAIRHEMKQAELEGDKDRVGELVEKLAKTLKRI